MLNNCFFFMDHDGGLPYILPMESLMTHGFGGHLFSQFSSFVNNSLYQSRYLHAPGSMALQEAFSCFSKFAGTLLFWFSSGSRSNICRKIAGDSKGSKPGICNSSTHVKSISSSKHYFAGSCFNSRPNGESATPVIFGKISSFVMKYLCREVERLQSCPILSLAAAVVPPFDNLSSKVLAVLQENADLQMIGCIDQRPCEVEHRGCAGQSSPDLNWSKHVVEPRTGIEFPIILDNILDGGSNFSITSEVLVGTGSRTMKIIRIKSLKVYAFGFCKYSWISLYASLFISLYLQYLPLPFSYSLVLDVHPNSVCEKLGPKYASIPVGELNKRHDFYEDLLREDINMTIRLVVNCNGLKIKTVRDAFEKSLRARLAKTNPDTDYHCLKAFGSYFSQDIQISVGTTIDFRQTADGQLITEIGGEQIGAVHSKDLCRAFFGMYIGDVPVSEQTKEEIGRNVAIVIQRC